MGRFTAFQITIAEVGEQRSDLPSQLRRSHPSHLRLTLARRSRRGTTMMAATTRTGLARHNEGKLKDGEHGGGHDDGGDGYLKT